MDEIHVAREMMLMSRSKRLGLSKDTIRMLDDDALAQAHGGQPRITDLQTEGPDTSPC